MPRILRPTLAVLAVLLIACAPVLAADYVPTREEWARQAPAAAGFDPDRLAAAVAWAQAHGEQQPADLRDTLMASFGTREPGYRILGPVASRGTANGMILRGGRIVAEWGDTRRPEMTFSVAKSMLSNVAGLLHDDGLLPYTARPVARDVPGPWFEGAHNGPITWAHLLQQTSDWSGTLWEVHDWADRPEGDDPSQRPLHVPGTRYKYNDVRVNLLALSLMEVAREPLPQLLRRRLMDPIGASSTWRWHGYDNSWITLDGLRMQAVSGGGHFGGGMFISTADLARFGLLMERDGQWQGRRLLSSGWIAQAVAPSPVKPDYGYLWWLNTGRQAIPAAPESAFWAAGFGGNHVYVDREHDLVIVVRWTPDLAGVVTRVLAALE
ncbi:serine hydrolase domain-containing protein [Pseudoxanthomonas daejeonensis]|uniref:Serine hydrolase n=1 Tax=Pseudoxanthomonas daejeonensis TaxID=266062 RepID=A0ABQ6Z6D7_9GAMM|nr:serine hydrolase [Pseudoxanthomonas daejeonensis]KAF1694091.1 serine hydrolase [Pseudoxanthomonas daejeonensis]